MVLKPFLNYFCAVAGCITVIRITVGIKEYILSALMFRKVVHVEVTTT